MKPIVSAERIDARVEVKLYGPPRYRTTEHHTMFPSEVQSASLRIIDDREGLEQLIDDAYAIIAAAGEAIVAGGAPRITELREQFYGAGLLGPWGSVDDDGVLRTTGVEATERLAKRINTEWTPT